MNRLRINNTTVFVAVLGACLGLLAAGASTHARSTASSVLSEIASAASANISLRHSPRRQLQLTAPYHAHALPSALQSEGGTGEALYRNTKPVTTPQQILVITTWPRASLEDSRA